MSMTHEKVPVSQAERDLDAVDGKRCPARSFPPSVRRQTQVQVVVRQSVLNEIHQHGQSTTDVEVCGVLVGNVYRDSRGPFVYVEAGIRGDRAASHAAQVTFTAETWAAIQETMDREHSDRRIVGWYHTHPGFGIFLSSMDMFIHENFFNGLEQLALVYDPLQAEEGLFVWRSGQPQAEPFSVEQNVDDAFPGIVVKVAPRPTLTAAAVVPQDEGRDSQVTELAVRLTNLERKQLRLVKSLIPTASLLVALLAIWPILWSRYWLAPRPSARPDETATGEIKVSPDRDKGSSKQTDRNQHGGRPCNERNGIEKRGELDSPRHPGDRRARTSADDARHDNTGAAPKDGKTNAETPSGNKANGEDQKQPKNRLSEEFGE